MIAAIPLRDFGSAKSRLAEDLHPEVRARVAAAIAERVAAACTAAGFSVVVVTAAPDVIEWCHLRDLRVIADPGTGLDGATSAAIATTTGPWLVVHGDLPLITSGDLAGIDDLVAEGRVVLAPSRDGGTNVIAASGEFRFAYGPGSFARHLAAAAHRHPLVLVRPGLAVELDTPTDLAATLRRADGRWLAAFLS